MVRDILHFILASIMIVIPTLQETLQQLEETMQPRIGYIGLGLMGKSMARNILQAGFELTVHNRSQAAVEQLVAEGAKSATSPRHVAEKSDIVFTNLPDTPDVEKVALGEKGVIEGCREGMIFIDNSTIKPESARQVAKRFSEVGVAALDAPVSGGDIGAKAGTLAIMVGGPKDAYEQAFPVFEAIGKAMKACNQIMVAAQMVAMGELLMLAQKSGVDPRNVIDAIKGGAAQCWALDVKPQRLFEGERRPGFKAYMMHKDLGIIMDSARTYGAPIPGTAVNMQLYEAMLQMGMRELDNSAVIGVLEQMAGAKLEEE